MTTTRTTLETLLTSKAGFALPASDLQRALCRAADGLPIGDALTDEQVRAAFGCAREQLGCTRPEVVVAVAGVRGGKSLIASNAAAHAALYSDLSALQPHEVARVPVVAPTVDNATATFRLLSGAIGASPTMRKLVIGETSESITLRRRDGRVVEIVVVAAHRGGITLRSRWLAGLVLDEAALFGVEASGAAVSAEELYRAGVTRLVPGGQAWIVSSPYGQAGLLFSLWRAHYGKPGRVLVVHAPTRSLNPSFPEAQIEAFRAENPDGAAREYDAMWVDPLTSFYDGGRIDAAVRPEPERVPPVRYGRYAAAMDPATRGNAWTLVIVRREVSRDNEERIQVVRAQQWIGSRVRPLDPDDVLGDIRIAVGLYDLDSLATDQWSSDALRSIAQRRRLRVVERRFASPEDRYNAYASIDTMLMSGRIELPPVPQFIADLKGVRKKALANGIRVDLPSTPDGRHCDFAPAFVLACREAGVARKPPSRGVMHHWLGV